MKARRENCIGVTETILSGMGSKAEPSDSQAQNKANLHPGSLVGCHLWGRTESDTTEVT